LRRRFDWWKSLTLAKLLIFSTQPFTFRKCVGKSLFNGQAHLIKLLKSEVKRDSKQFFHGAIARCVRANQDSIIAFAEKLQSRITIFVSSKNVRTLSKRHRHFDFDEISSKSKWRKGWFLNPFCHLVIKAVRWDSPSLLKTRPACSQSAATQ